MCDEGTQREYRFCGRCHSTPSVLLFYILCYMRITAETDDMRVLEEVLFFFNFFEFLFKYCFVVNYDLTTETVLTVLVEVLEVSQVLGRVGTDYFVSFEELGEEVVGF